MKNGLLNDLFYNRTIIRPCADDAQAWNRAGISAPKSSRAEFLFRIAGRLPTSRSRGTVVKTIAAAIGDATATRFPGVRGDAGNVEAESHER